LSRHLVTCAIALLAAAPASAQLAPARFGETGLLDVPDAELVGTYNSHVGSELRLDRIKGQPNTVGPLPIYAVTNIARTLDLGLAVREWGQPGDHAPAHALWTATLKLQLLKPAGLVPGAAVDAYVDRFNTSPVVGLRAIGSTAYLGPVRVAAFLGGELWNEAGVTAGLAASLMLPRSTELLAEGLVGPRGANVGAGFKWHLNRVIDLGTGVNYLPGSDGGLRAYVSFAIAPPPRPLPPVVVARARTMAREEEARAEEPATLALGERPAFRLKIHAPGIETEGEPRHRQHGVRVAAAEQLPTGPAKITTPTAAGPSAEDVFESQLRDQEAAADARERRLKATEDSLKQRELAVANEAQQLDAREQQLSAREIQFDAREKRIVLRGPPTPTEKAIEAREAQLGTAERQLLAQERGFQPTVETAAGRERDAAAREQLERADAERLGAEWRRAKDRVTQLDLRRQALSARTRQLGATEARLLAMGERIDAMERQLRTRSERLDTWQRRLDARAERLEALEKRSSDQRRPTEAPKPTETPVAAAAAPTPEAKAAKEKAVFVMVVKSPTAIMKETAATPAATAAPSAPASGAAVEKGVAAATVVAFPTPQSELSELDRESIENIAKLAARENCELLVWARAKSPALQAEAQRRADDIKKRAIAAGPLDGRRVVTRVTTRPGAVGVDVVVSAVRDQAQKPAPAGAPGPAGTPAGPGIQMLGAGETGKRQIRDSVLRAQPAIEACVGEQIQRKSLTRAEGVLKLTVAANGRVVLVKASEGDLSGAEMETCLTEAARTWQFPAAEGEYVVDVPITVIGGGAAK
jgi:hypothetical protein